MKKVKNLIIEKKLDHENEHLDAPDSERNKRNSKSKYITQILYNFKNSEQNKRLDDLISALELFKKNYRQNLEQIKLETQESLTSLFQTQLLIYNALQKNLIEISCLSNQEIRTDRINKLYLWFKEKIQINEDLRKINMKSYKEIDEITEDDLLIWGKGKASEEDSEKKDLSKSRNKDIHRNNELLDKNQINEYKRKLLSKSLEERIFKLQNSEDIGEEEDNFLSGKDNAELAKTLMSLQNQDFSGGNFSTFYSNKFGTNISSLAKFRITQNELNMFRDTAKGSDQQSNFFPNYNKETKLYFPPLSKETKFSYSFNRPEYNYENMMYENKIINCKMRLQAEKRAQEEIKSQIEQMGMARAKYKEGVNNKYEIKSIINMYVENNDFSSPLLKKYKLKSSKSMNDIHSNKKNDLFKKINSRNSEFNIGISKINQQSDDLKRIEDEGINKINEESDNTQKSQNIVSISPNKESSKNIKNPRLKKKKTEKRIVQGLTNKIKTDSVKNIENKKVLEPLQLNTVKLKLKVLKEKVQSDMLKSIKKNVVNPPSETLTKIMSTDDLFYTHKAYNELCNLSKKQKNEPINNNLNKENNNISKETDESYSNNFCLSLYDKANLRKINKYRNRYNYDINKINDSRTIRNDPKLKFVQLHKTYNLYKNNFLDLRRTVSDWKRGEYITLLDKIKKNNSTKKEKEKKDENVYTFQSKKKNIRKQNSLLNAIINPKDEFAYSQFFLPRTGTLLLKRSEEPKVKHKGK